MVSFGIESKYWEELTLLTDWGDGNLKYILYADCHTQYTFSMLLPKVFPMGLPA